MSDIKIIIIIVLAVIVLALGVVSFIPFGGKKLLCPAVTSSNIADTGNCASFCKATDCSSAITATSCALAGFMDGDSTPPSATSCKTFIDAATVGMGPNPEAFYTDIWCKNKYATLSTESEYCKEWSSNISNFLSNVATTFSTAKLIKRSAGTTNEDYFDPSSTADVPSPPVLTSGTALDAWVLIHASKKLTAEALSAKFFSLPGMSVVPENVKVLEQFLAYIDVITNSQTISKSSTGVFTVSATTTPTLYSAMPASTWISIGAGATWTYSYLSVTSTVINAMKAELTKDGISIFSNYC